jgi:methionine-S-sulfoxide reductase
MGRARSVGVSLLAAAILAGPRGAAGAAQEASVSPMSDEAIATFAGGCFWCMEPPFEQLEGVRSVTAGYAGGTGPKPTYEEVSSGATGYLEAVQVAYDPATVTYQQLLDAFWRNVDPTQADGQFADQGRQYRTAIFYHTEEQQRLALASKEQLARSGTFDKPIVTEILPATAFYPAEEDHQDYYKKHPLRYKLYRIGSGREGFLKRTWGQTEAGGGQGR